MITHTKITRRRLKHDEKTYMSREIQSNDTLHSSTRIFNPYFVSFIPITSLKHIHRYMLPPDGLWTYDSAIARYNAADRAAQSKFWENELKSTENLLEDIVKQTHEYVEKKHEKGLSLHADIPQPAIELDALLNVQYQSTSEVIVSKAEQVNAAMIIVVKHDKGWLTRLIEGQSISTNIEKKSKIPVLVYHAGHMLTKEEEIEAKEKEAKMPGGKHASQTKL
jgi:nucleotide-binding universal stress UspA family protein